MYKSLKSTYLCLFVTTFAVLITACKSPQKTAQTPPKTEIATPLSTQAIFDKWEAQSLKTPRMNGDADLDYIGKPMNISASATVRWRRDSVLWLNVKKLGFNIARAQVTRDSVFILNYFQSTYTAKPLDFIEKQYGIPANFTTLQDILLGKPIFLIDKKQLQLNTPKDKEDPELKGSNERWTAIYKTDFATQQLKEMTFEEPKNQRILTISYEKYALLRDFDGIERPFPYVRTILADSPKTGKVRLSIEIDVDNVEMNVIKNIRFEIPSGYTRVD